MASERFPELVTARTLREETGLPDSTVRAIIQRAVRDGNCTPIKTIRTVMFRRDELAPYFGLDRQSGGST
jgi:hypothetical protein